MRLDHIIHVHGIPLHVKGILAMLGGCLILLTFAIDFSYANLNTYVISYLRQKNVNLTYGHWIFVSTVKTIVAGLVMPFLGELSRIIGLKISLILGCLIFCFGYLITPLFLEKGLIFVVISIGACHGIGFSLTYAQAIGAVMKWFPGNQGFMTSFCVAGYGFGGAIWNPLETAFVNPDNVKAESVPGGGSDKYFLDEDVLGRVPELFYLLGGIFIVMQTLGIILISEPSKEELEQIQDFGEHSDLEQLTKKEDKVEPYSVKPLEVLRTTEFYKLWISFLAVSMVNGFINNYQKTFGQIYISDDHFFAVVATISQFANGLSRIFWGKVFDSQGYQFCVFLIISLGAAASFSFVDLAAFPIDSVGSRIFYAVWIIGIYCVFPGIYACMAPATMQTFGPKHYSSIYGLVWTQNIAYSFLIILSTNYLGDIFGYSGMFFFTGFIGIIGMISTYLFPEGLTSEHYRSRFEAGHVSREHEDNNTEDDED